MHELGLCADIVEAIERRAGERSVAKVTVRVGRLHHVHPDAFDQSFAVAAQGTIAEHAAATLVLVPITGRCGACGHVWETDEMPVLCPECGGFDIELIGGDELILESIEFGN